MNKLWFRILHILKPPFLWITRYGTIKRRGRRLKLLWLVRIRLWQSRLRHNPWLLVGFICRFGEGCVAVRTGFRVLHDVPNHFESGSGEYELWLRVFHFFTSFLSLSQLRIGLMPKLRVKPDASFSPTFNALWETKLLSQYSIANVRINGTIGTSSPRRASRSA
jgi:hypothetical protein